MLDSALRADMRLDQSLLCAKISGATVLRCFVGAVFLFTTGFLQAVQAEESKEPEEAEEAEKSRGAWSIPEEEWKSPPTQERLAWLNEKAEHDPGEVAQILLQGLAGCYEPATAGRRSGNSQPAAVQAFRQWWLVAQWWELLSRKESAEWQRFLRRYLAISSVSSAPADAAEENAAPDLLYREPGQSFGDDVQPVPAGLLEELASDPRWRSRNAGHFLPGDFRFRDGLLREHMEPATASALAGNPEFLQEFFSLLSPEDFTPGVVANLQRLWQVDPSAFSDYFRLALALAVVFDQKSPSFWPHDQVAPADLPPDGQTLEERYAFWREAHATRRLATDITRTGADQLRFLVDALVPAQELLYARNKVRIPRSQFEKAFSSIRYDFSRIEKQAFDWPEGTPYTLANIQKLGGICVDQAYFAMIAGKALGVPTLFFVGQGADGGHAWFGFLRGEDRWNLDAGRYENQNYAVGYAMDPQNWEPITDHELQFLAARTRRSPDFQAGLMDLWWADYFLHQRQIDRAQAAVAGALAASPQNPAAWEADIALREAQGVPYAEMRSLLEKAIRQFQSEPDVRVRFQRSLIEAARSAGDEQLAQTLSTSLITQNRRTRSDLSVGAAAEKMQALLSADDIAGAMQEFRAQASRLGRTGGGDFFYEVVRPLVEYLLEKNQPREARRVVDTARRQLRPEPGSILDQELKALAEQVAKR